MDENQSENGRINQQLIQEALSSQLDQQNQQPNNYATFFLGDNAQTTGGNVANFETLAPYQNFAGGSSLYMQDSGLASSLSSNNTMDPLRQQRVYNIAPNAMQHENEYIYQQYLEMMNNNNHHSTALDLNLQGFFPQQQQQKQQQQQVQQQQPPPVIPLRQEQDVFNELLNMASNSSLQNNLWYDGHTNPAAFIHNADASMLITQQEQEASYYNNMAASSNRVNFTSPLQDKPAKDGAILEQVYGHPLANEYR